MKHSDFRSIVRQKMTVVLAALALLGLVGSVNVFLQPASSVYAASQRSMGQEQQEVFSLHFRSSVHAAPSCFSYTVRSGDTLSYIAMSNGSSVQAIAQANSIANVDLIFPGQRFCIPTSDVSSPTGGTGSGTGTTGSGTGQNSVTDMIYQVFGSDAQGALNVANCESGLNPDAYNPISIGGSHAAGVFQILYPSTWMGTSQAANSPYNAMANILAAHAIFVRDGYSWSEWTCQP